MLDTLPAEGFAYSLLRAYQPTLTKRYGWVPIEEELLRSELFSFDPGSIAITPLSDEDLCEVMNLYEETNAGRTGSTIRSPECWRGQLEWVEEDRDGFLVARREKGALVGYVRSRVGSDATESLELGLGAGGDVGPALLSAAAARRGGRLHGRLPSSLRRLFRLDELEVTGGSG
jgi:hypothetical protein